MAQSFPYTYISCPCSDASRRLVTSKRTSREVQIEQELDEEEKTFDPHSPRAAFSLFPPEHLLYCEECHDIKCPRCVTEEIISWYCPSCLFESPSSSVKADTNRCSRNCFSCPICSTQLITASLGEKSTGPFILSCTCCTWSSMDIGIKFEKPNNMRAQLDKISNGGKPKPSFRKAKDHLDILRKNSGLSKEKDLLSPTSPGDETNPMDAAAQIISDPYAQFEALKAFYRDQLAVSMGGTGVVGSGLDGGYSSPSSLSRIMSLYTSAGGTNYKKTKQQTTPMREALITSEGLVIPNSDEKVKLHLDYSENVSPQQQSLQYPLSSGNPSATQVSQLRPMSTLLRTKRSKRCALCKHILVKPDAKVGSTRYRIRLIALSYIPSLSLKPVPTPGGLRPAGPDGADVVLEPGKPSQWIMTLRNPLFESVNVSLGSPNVTPGKHGHRVTILCPQFSIDKNGDVWDDALNTNLAKGDASTAATGGSGAAAGEQIAGKLYDSGRNWASVVIEIVPKYILKENGEVLEEDEDVIEIPIRVRLEWTLSDEAGERRLKKSEKVLDEEVDHDDGKRELAYWMVVGVGRVKS